MSKLNNFSNLNEYSKVKEHTNAMNGVTLKSISEYPNTLNNNVDINNSVTLKNEYPNIIVNAIKKDNPMVNTFEDAKIFAFFIKHVRETQDNGASVSIYNMISNVHDDKYKCIYCGCEYVYRRSLISHLKRLHNIKNIK